jgi:DNA-binding MarR family transcriptional regulator
MDLAQLARALGLFATLDPIEFPLHRAQLFLEVAKAGPAGITFRELEERLSLTNGSVSRGVMALGDVDRKGGQGYRLVAVHKDPDQPRRYRVKLTARGQALLRQLETT